MLVTILVQNSKAVNEDFNEVQKTSNIFNVRVMLGVYESVLVGIWQNCCESMDRVGNCLTNKIS